MNFSDPHASPRPCDDELPEFEYDMATADLVGDILDEIARALEVENQRCGMTKSTLAARMKRNKSVVSRLLKGERSLNLTTVARIVRALDHYPQFQLLPLYSEPGGNSKGWHELQGLVRKPIAPQTPTPSQGPLWVSPRSDNSTAAIVGFRVKES